MEPSADIGSRPELAWLALDVLVVDPRYQRDAGTGPARKRIARIVEAFCWRRFQPLSVARLPRDGAADRYAVLDGQNRAEAARLHPLVDAVPCLIVDAPDVALQADSFVWLNRERGSVSATQLHFAELTARAPDAVHLDEVCRAVGVSIARTARTGGLAPGETIAVGILRRLLARHGDAPVKAALRAMNEAAGDSPDQLRGSMIGGVVGFCARYGKDPGFDHARLVDTLADMDAETWLMTARTYRKAHGGQTQDVIRDEIFRRYHRGLKTVLRQLS